MFAGKKSAQIREILISESAWEEMTCLFAPSLNTFPNLQIFISSGILSSAVLSISFGKPLLFFIKPTKSDRMLFVSPSLHNIPNLDFSINAEIFICPSNANCKQSASEKSS
ncbi:hypothetical protein C2U42_35640 [Klebsiella oxytoca]|nr:hypothetical protein C2U42_35640 [Klebsiella oxytoca]